MPSANQSRPRTHDTARPAQGTAPGVAGPQPDFLAALVRPAHRSLTQAALWSCAAALVWLAQAAVIATTLGALIRGDPVHAATSALALPALALAALGLAALGLLRAGLGLRADHLAQAAAQGLLWDLRDRIVRTEAQRTSPSSLGGAGALASLATSKVDMLAPYVVRYRPALMRAAIVAPVILCASFTMSWVAGLILLVSGPLIPVFMALVGVAAKEASARQLSEIGTLDDLLVERLSALLDIRLLGAGPEVTATFARQAAGLRQRTMAVLRVAFLSSTVLELFASIGVAMMAVYVGFSLLGAIGFGGWGAPLSPARGIFLLLIAPDFFQPLRDLAAAWHDRAAAGALADEFHRWQGEDAPTLPGQGCRVTPLTGSPVIMMRGCRTLRGDPLPDLTIAPGEAVALVGPSGSGKTTALRLIAGLLDPGAGRVIVAGRLLSPDMADAWRARLGWMPQSVHFLNASLRYNLTFGRDAAIDAALAAAAAQEVVAALPHGLASRIGETGAGLSGGEARRVTLARAICASPDVLLADEPTADLDPETAAAVTAGLLAQQARGATVIVATHDMHLAARMDRVIQFGADE